MDTRSLVDILSSISTSGWLIILGSGGLMLIFGAVLFRETSREHLRGSILALYSQDLTTLAHSGKLDPVIGRNEEMERVIQILSRRTKNNAVLIGDSGVGKTAIVEGLANLIAQGDVPDPIKGKRILALDLSGLVAGTKYRGEFEKRLKTILDEVVSSERQIILFIDELHTLAEAGEASGAIDAADILKPALARGELQAIGATTQQEYEDFIVRDVTLERRFQPVVVKEPDATQTMSIITGLRTRYEQHHQVKINDDALQAAVKLSSTALPDRHFPDKAIDAMDEAAARVRLNAIRMKQPSSTIPHVTAADVQHVIGEWSKDLECFSSHHKNQRSNSVPESPQQPAAGAHSR